MRKIKKYLIPVLCAVLLLSAAGSAPAEETAVRVFRLGTSAYTVEIPESLVEREVTEEAAGYGMAAYLADVDAGLLIEVYQISRDENTGTLAEFTAREAALYGGTDVVAPGEINGLAAGWYTVPGTPDDAGSGVFYLILEDETGFTEIVFSVLSGDGSEMMKGVLDSLKKEP